MSRTVTLHNTSGTLLITLLTLDRIPSANTPVRNYDPVQPPGSTVQGVFGDGIYQVGVLERDFALCDVSSYSSVFHAKAALDTALETTASVRVDGWALPIAAAVGVSEFAHMLTGFRARIRFIPSSASWTLISDGTTTTRGIL